MDQKDINFVLIYSFHVIGNDLFYIFRFYGFPPQPCPIPILFLIIFSPIYNFHHYILQNVVLFIFLLDLTTTYSCTIHSQLVMFLL